MNQQKSISLEELAKKVGMTTGPISMLDIAEKVGHKERPIGLSELAITVDKYIKANGEPKPNE